jgi:DNA-binding IscR family transcriptional regulator
LEGAWLGLATLVLVLERFREKQPITPHEALAERLSLKVPELRLAIQPLVEGKFLRENLGEENGYLLSCDPYQVKVAEVLDLYEESQRQLLDALPKETSEHLERIRTRLAASRTQVVADLTLSDLMARSDAEREVEPDPEGEADAVEPSDDAG